MICGILIILLTIGSYLLFQNLVQAKELLKKSWYLLSHSSSASLTTSTSLSTPIHSGNDSIPIMRWIPHRLHTSRYRLDSIDGFSFWQSLPWFSSLIDKAPISDQRRHQNQQDFKNESSHCDGDANKNSYFNYDEENTRQMISSTIKDKYQGHYLTFPKMSINDHREHRVSQLTRLFKINLEENKKKDEDSINLDKIIERRKGKKILEKIFSTSACKVSSLEDDHYPYKRQHQLWNKNKETPKSALLYNDFSKANYSKLQKSKKMIPRSSLDHEDYYHYHYFNHENDLDHDDIKKKNQNQVIGRGATDVVDCCVW